MSKISPIVYIGGAAAVYFLFLRPATPGAASPLASILPGSTTALIGINSGIKGGNGSYYTVSNYAALIAANPNLANPNYQLSPAENAQYIANYQDLQTGLAIFVAQGGVNGVKFNTMQAAAQYHWTNYGPQTQRIFVPMQPPSTAAYVPPPVAPKAASSGNFLSDALSVATKVVPIVAAIAGEYNAPQLNDADVELLFTSAAIIKQILPFYAGSDIVQVNRIDTTLDNLLIQYI